MTLCFQLLLLLLWLCLLQLLGFVFLCGHVSNLNAACTCNVQSYLDIARFRLCGRGRQSLVENLPTFPFGGNGGLVLGAH